jgi:predicted metal-dependent phosphotriesterase family hydrolase
MKPTRRQFIHRASVLGVGMSLGLSGCKSTPTRQSLPQIMTVTGPVPANQIGITLPHEHLLVDFIGARGIQPGRYDPAEVFRTALPHLQAVRGLGCQTFFDCTPAFLGRDAILLQDLSRASGLRIVTNTGLYGAAQDKYLPALALEESPDALAERWTHEALYGIEGTGIRPGFIKIGVDSGRLSPVHERLVRAAARTRRRTGLAIASHTGNGQAAMHQLEVLQSEAMAANGFIWVHAQSEPDTRLHLEAARRGAWIEFDGIHPDTIAQHVALVRNMREHGLLHRVLVSHDAGWYHVGEPGGGVFRNYETLFTQFIPALQNIGFKNTEFQRLLADNPRDAFGFLPSQPGPLPPGAF